VAFIEALSSLGVPITEELNTGNNVGAKQALMTMDATQQRSSAYDNYFMLAKERPNLTVRTLATVSQLIVEETEVGPSVAGVIYTEGLSGATTNVTATKEVIISAGTFQTPQLLILSGIGPQRTLEKFGIMPYVVNNNIGQNLQDHTYFSVIARSVPETSASQLYNNITILQAAEQQFNTTKTGPLTVPVGPNYGWQKLPLEKLKELNATELLGDRANQAHIEYLWENIYYPAGPSPDGLQHPPNKNESFFSITAGLVAPVSKGNVSIMSNSIQDPPLINLNVGAVIS
jgi:choline dehydrogenase